MAIIVTDMEGNIQKTIKLPCSGDCSYPGMIMCDGKLWVSYYSKHEGKASIFLAKIPLSEF